MSAGFENANEFVRRFTPRVLRNWLRQPKRSIDYLVDHVAYLLRGPSEVEVRPDWRPRCHPASRNHFRIFATDPAQAAELDTFIAYCCSGMQFLDVGAHYGLFALAAAHFGGQTAKVVAVEVSAKASRILKVNLAANNTRGRVQVVNTAMGECDGALEMLATGPAGSDYFVSAPPGRTDTISVRQLSMPTILRQTKLQPTHVKIDIEGFESEAIFGAMDYLSRFRPILFLELHLGYLRRRGRDPTEILRQLRECGYTEFEENGARLSEEELMRRDLNCRVVCRSGSRDQTAIKPSARCT